MVSILTWTPAEGGGTQTIQFKLRPATDWASFTTVGPTIASQAITGLNYNSLYDFRVVNNCPTGGSTVLEGADIKFQCVSLNVTPSDTSLTAQFPDLGGTVDTYTVELYNTQNVLLSTNTLLAPFPSTLTSTFTGLSPITTYRIKVIPASSTFSKTDCTQVSAATINTPACPAPLSLDGSFTGSDITLTWIPQAGIVAQEVWFGRLTDVGATLPPSTGWNPGSNLYSATDNTTILSNLQPNTKYAFAVRSRCNQGSSSWTTIDRYFIGCPSISITPHSTTADVSIVTTNASEFKKIASSITLTILDSSNSVVTSGSLSGLAWQSTVLTSFNGLSPSSNYTLKLEYTPLSGGTPTFCSSQSFSTTAVATCPAPIFTVTNINSTGFTVTPSGLVAGDTYDISLNNGVTYAYLHAQQPAQVITGLIQGTTYPVKIRRNCVNGLQTVTSAQSITTTSPNFVVNDIWYNCPGPCDGRAIYLGLLTIRDTVTNTIVYTYTSTFSTGPNFSTFVSGLVAGRTYTIAASWNADLSKTNGFIQVSISANGSSQTWPATGSTAAKSLNFVAASSNNIQIGTLSAGPKCAC